MTDITTLAQLGGTVVTVAMFLWYMQSRNGKQENVLDNIHKAQEQHTRVLLKVAENHGLDREVNKLIEHDK